MFSVSSAALSQLTALINDADKINNHDRQNANACRGGRAEFYNRHFLVIDGRQTNLLVFRAIGNH
jgi:hypothetical protein